MKMLHFKNNFFNYFILLYLIVSIFASLNVGITHDEFHNLDVWNIKKNIYLNYLFNSNLSVEFDDLGMKYYGVGFHFFSLPFELIFNFIFSNLDLTELGKTLMLKHPSIVIIFTISGIYFQKILNFIVQNKTYASLSAIFYLSYPYLLGHSFFNFKDIPFMSIWVICTFFIIKISNIFFKRNEIKNLDLFLLAILTSFLISIRISGILIFFEFFVFALITYQISKINFKKFLKIITPKLLLFILTFISSLFLLHPTYWTNPFIFFDSINYMSQHIQTVCTTTFGECMKAQNLPSSYLPLWLLVKLPIIILVGFLILPLIDKKIFSNDLHSINIGSLILSIIIIMLNVIFFNFHLYDEIRQVMFLVPLCLIISLSVIYFFSNKISKSILIIYLIFFLFQNIKIFPYNYLWLNNFSTIAKITNNFELDYWGVSTKNIAKFFKKNKLNKDECIISNRNDGIKQFLNLREACFINFRNLHKKNQRPFFVVLTERSMNKGVPNNCEKIYDENFKMNFSKEKLVVAKIFKCS